MFDKSGELVFIITFYWINDRVYLSGHRFYPNILCGCVSSLLQMCSLNLAHR